MRSVIRYASSSRRGDCPQARRLVEGVNRFGHVVADTAYDAEHFRRFIDDELGATVPIPSNSSRAGELQIDEELYKARHLVESFFLVIKRFRRIALRYEKTASSFQCLRRSRLRNEMARLNEDTA